jgi:imidazolonepropionase-like amidohydrolase
MQFLHRALAQGAFSLVAAATALPIGAQQSTNRLEGIRDHTPRHHALTGVRLFVAPGKVIDNGTLVIKDGRIVAAGANLPAPKAARVWHLPGRTVYAGFIDLAASVGVPAAARARGAALPFNFDGPPPPPQAAIETNAPGARGLSSRNRSVRTDFDVAAHLDWKADEVKALRELGFTAALATPRSGVWRGQSALLLLAERADAKANVLLPRAAQHAANEYERGFGTGAQYPNSMMGAIALVRQTLYDAKWYKAASEAVRANPAIERVEPNASLEALLPVLARAQPLFYLAEGEQDFQRIAKIRDEFELSVVAVGNGYEYRRSPQIKSLGLPVIVPLEFPAVPEVENPDAALDVQLEQLQHWEQAPSNPATLAAAGIEFALSPSSQRDPKEFWNHLRLAVRRGLSGDAALAALTTTPARLIGMGAKLGTLEAGKLANLVVASGDLFSSADAEIELAFVDGQPHATAAAERGDVRGKWSAPGGAVWDIKGSKVRPTLSIDGQGCEMTVRQRQVTVHWPCGKGVTDRQLIVAELDGDTLRGSIAGKDAAAAWTATRTARFAEPAPPRAEEAPPAWAGVYPAGAYGMPGVPPTASVLVKNATVWTSGPAGKLSNADVLVRDGKIAAVGANLAATQPGVTVIDATGKHLTPGLIDAHSHTAAVGGLNESTSSITAEVRVADVLDATSINLYRQLAGGVTAANVMHGSANTIGGQTQTIKLRWGQDAEGLKFANALPGIKFALGENVKQANFNTEQTRYPQTRMGVDQLVRDAFAAARHYQKRWAQWRANPKAGVEPRRDLQLDALVELLEKKRAVHIHSYRADEILAFARTAKELGIPVATFQHVLEGYKVADAIRDLGAGASSFSDWWAYKMEVYDAIPWNGAMLHAAGVLTSFNSDSDELARRLNTEAAKAVRYGGLKDTEALKFVTLNAARQLGIDRFTGSLEVGKDADFVIWSADPLSPRAIAEQTWIDGRRYYDLTTDARLRSSADGEKRRLLVKALPVRLARLQASPASADVRAPAAPPEPPPEPGGEVRELIAHLQLQRALHLAAHYRREYWNGREWHECTEDAR